ncbi:hypothetical protein HYT24_00610 [Candidatus Pacearchaeota archaeon]|nr:hypothetical protein [Candidatus Pacearchaeota archaeon]
MKRVLVVFLVLCFLPLISAAANLSMKENFSQGETLTAKVSGNLYQPITENDVEFYIANERTSIIPFVEEINNEFYVYAQLEGKSEGNYSIVIKNVKYIQAGQLVEDGLSRNFSITNMTADFSVNPAALIVLDDFIIEAKNMKDSEVKIIAKVNETKTSSGFFDWFSDDEEENNTYILPASETKNIRFNSSQFNKTGLAFIEIKSTNTKYNVPVYITKVNTLPTTKEFRINPPVINISMATNSNTTRIIYIENLGADLENVSFTISDSLKPYLMLSSNLTDEIDYNDSYRINVTINSSSSEKYVEGQITARSGTEYAYSAVYLYFVKDFIPANNTNGTIETIIQKCFQVNGTLCGEANMKCEGTEKYAADGICCIGKCVEIKKSSVGKYIGWGILIAILAFVGWFYLRRYKKVQSVSDFAKFTKK